MPITFKKYPELSIKQRNQLFAEHADTPGSFLLDSGSATDVNARFDIIAVKPVSLISGKNCLDQNPLQQLRDNNLQIADKAVPEQIRYLPCIGGAFFALSYELGKYFENLSDTTEDDLQLEDYYAGIYGCILVIDRSENCSFVICSDLRSESTYQLLLKQVEQVLQNPHQTEQSFKLETNWQANFNESDYSEAFNKVQSYIQAGDCYQINLAQRFKASCSGSSWQAYCLLSEANNAPFSSFVNTESAQILSLSPERFIKVRNNRVETKPIKGTRPRGLSLEQDQQLKTELLQSKKDQAENLMIVDLMRNDLGRSCKAGSISVPELFTLETFHSVHHLVSTVVGELDKGENAFSLMANCFPGGSITGTPKIRAMDIIDELEPHRRTFYCGSIGYIDGRGNMDSNICIRTLVRKDDSIYCWAGGGLVSASNQQDEYQETFDKLSRILPVLSPSHYD